MKAPGAMLVQLLRSGAIYGLANVMAAGVPFLLLPVLTRALSPAEYGEVVSFFMLVSVSAALAGLSLHGAVGVRWLDASRGDPKSSPPAWRRCWVRLSVWI